MEILITANSPGEIIGWMLPVVRKLKQKEPSVKITVGLLPCVFASGREYETAQKVQGVDRVLRVGETLKIILPGKSVEFDKELSILHLGGDLFYAYLLAKKLKARVFAYEWANKSWDDVFEGYFVRDEANRQDLLKKGIKGKKIFLAGDPLIDSVRMRSEEAEDLGDYDGLTVTFLPGSRIREAKGLIPVFCGTAENIRDNFPKSRFFIPISPFIDREELKKLSPLIPLEDFPGCRVVYSDNRFITEKGVEIGCPGNSLSAMKTSDLIVSIPGTSTGEAGILGRPTYCIVPSNRPEAVPFVGVVGMLNFIPIVGNKLKRHFMLKIAEKIGLLAQPNLRAGREIIPESIKTVDPGTMFGLIEELLRNKEKREKMSRELLGLYSPLAGAAGIMADRLLSVKPGIKWKLDQ